MPEQLTTSGFARARDFIRARARPLDQRLFEYYFESGPPEAVVRELSRFQNADKGFGRALEADFRLPASSPMATTVAFQYLREVGASASDELVRQGIDYFVSTYDAERPGWRATPDEVNEHPHAPWRHVNYEQGSAVDLRGWANPSAEIVGYLHQFSSLVSTHFLEEVTRLTNEHIRSLPDELDIHATFCYLRLVETFPSAEKDVLLEKLRISASAGAQKYPDWPGPGAKLVWLVSSPKSLLADVLGDALQANLDEEIGQQDDDGAWSPNWTWGGLYPDAWEEAERDWKGYITVQMLKVLRAFDRIEKV